MSAPVTTDASGLIELLAGFGYDTVTPEECKFEVELFDMWGGSGELFTAPVRGCFCLRQVAESE
jgi:hypothetical protein